MIRVSNRKQKLEFWKQKIFLPPFECVPCKLQFLTNSGFRNHFQKKHKDQGVPERYIPTGRTRELLSSEKKMLFHLFDLPEEKIVREKDAKLKEMYKSFYFKGYEIIQKFSQSSSFDQKIIVDMQRENVKLTRLFPFIKDEPHATFILSHYLSAYNEYINNLSPLNDFKLNQSIQDELKSFMSTQYHLEREDSHGQTDSTVQQNTFNLSSPYPADSLNQDQFSSSANLISFESPPPPIIGHQEIRTNHPKYYPQYDRSDGETILPLQIPEFAPSSDFNHSELHNYIPDFPFDFNSRQNNWFMLDNF